MPTYQVKFEEKDGKISHVSFSADSDRDARETVKGRTDCKKVIAVKKLR